MLEVQPDRALVAAERLARRGGVVAPRVSRTGGMTEWPRLRTMCTAPLGWRGLLDEEHVGAEIAEQHRAIRAGHGTRQIEDADPVERHHRGPDCATPDGDRQEQRSNTSALEAQYGRVGRIPGQ